MTHTPDYSVRPPNFVFSCSGLGFTLLGHMMEKVAWKDFVSYMDEVAQHSGGMELFRARLIILPEQKLGVVVLANSSTADPVVGEVSAETLKLALQRFEAGKRKSFPLEVSCPRWTVQFMWLPSMEKNEFDTPDMS